MKILSKEILVASREARIIKMKIAAPHIASQVLPGQFAVLMVSQKGERIPLTVVESDKECVTLIFQEAGFTTRLLGQLTPGDSLYALAGPLGVPTEIRNFGKAILVGGGVGIAEIYPVAKVLKGKGNFVVTILGARTKELLILEQELKSVSDKVHVVTDDGSYGEKGFTTTVLERLLNEQKYDLVYAVGPIPMMKNAATVTKKSQVKTVVSLNALMVDATGMCGCCRVTVAGAMKFSCVDGPEFDAHAVDWDELIKRNRVYDAQEKHICALNKVL